MEGQRKACGQPSQAAWRTGLRALIVLSSLMITGSVMAQTLPTVTVSAPLQRELVEYTEYTGQFAAVEYVELRARVSGYLQSHHFEEGQIVKKGDLLFVIDRGRPRCGTRLASVGATGATKR
jgi:multidrug efflux pump subunit AcrA (membrane-fusion protein)